MLKFGIIAVSLARPLLPVIPLIRSRLVVNRHVPIKGYHNLRFIPIKACPVNRRGPIKAYLEFRLVPIKGCQGLLV